MSDTQPTETAPVETTPAPATEPTPAADPFDSPDTTSFPRDYVERLRNENAQYRTKAKELEERWTPWDETLGGFEAEEREAARQLLAAIREGDTATVAAILGQPTAAAPSPEPVGETPQPLTAADLDRILSEREAKAAQDAALRDIENEAKGLGYNPGATKGSDEWLSYSQLLALASARTGGNLAAAHQIIETNRQAQIDAYLAQKGGQGATPAPPINGVPPSGERAAVTLDDSRKAMLERLGARQAG